MHASGECVVLLQAGVLRDARSALAEPQARRAGLRPKTKVYYVITDSPARRRYPTGRH